MKNKSLGYSVNALVGDLVWTSLDPWESVWNPTLSSTYLPINKPVRKLVYQPVCDLVKRPVWDSTWPEIVDSIIKLYSN